MNSEEPSDNDAEASKNERTRFELDNADAAEEEVAVAPNCCFQCLGKCRRLLSTSYHPLPADPTILERLAFAFRCPAHGAFGVFLTGVIVIACLYAILFVLAGPELVLPGSCEPVSLENGTEEAKNMTERVGAKEEQKCTGQLFGLFALFICAMLAGIAVNRWLPPLLGKSKGILFDRCMFRKESLS